MVVFSEKDLFFDERLLDFRESFADGDQEAIKMALNEAQDIFACVDRKNLQKIAETFSVEEKLVENIMRFMPSIKESKVDYEIVVCTGRRCGQIGAREIIEKIKDRLGIYLDESSPDGKYRLTSKNCFKMCGKGPNVLVNDDFYHEMDARKMDLLLKDLK